MSEFLRYTIFGLAFAGVYFIAASGLVVTYSTSGIFNFAHGAVAMIAAFSYWELRVRHHWPAPLAFVGVVFVLAPIMGVVIERLVMRNLGGAATITNIVVTIGLLVTLLGIALGGVGAEQVRSDAFASEVLPGERRQRRGCADPVALPLRSCPVRRRRVEPVGVAHRHPTRHRHASGGRRPEPGSPQRRESRGRVGRRLGRRFDARRAGRGVAGADPRPRRGAPHPAGDQRVRGRGRRPAAQLADDRTGRGDSRAGGELLRLGPEQDASRAGRGAEHPRLAPDHHAVRGVAGPPAGSHPVHGNTALPRSRRRCRR